MNKSILTTLVVVIMIGFCSCEKKDSEPMGTPPTLEVQLAGDAHIGQPIIFKLPSVAAATTVNWTVTPNKATINASGNTATISFQTSGSYVVNGTSGSASGSSTVKVDSVNYLPVNGTTVVPFSTGEQLIITAKRNDSSATTSGLTFTMQTVGSYSCQNSILSFTATNGSGGAATYAINIAGISVPLVGCTAGSSKSSGSASTKVPLPAGTTTLTIGFNGTVYTGSIVKTGNSYSINWSYTSGVTISPLSL
jgi:hypothetical protein